MRSYHDFWTAPQRKTYLTGSLLNISDKSSSGKSYEGVCLCFDKLILLNFSVRRPVRQQGFVSVYAS